LFDFVQIWGIEKQNDSGMEVKRDPRQGESASTKKFNINDSNDDRAMCESITMCVR